MMKSRLLQGESDIQLMRDLIEHLPCASTIVDFDEAILLDSVRAATRLWQHDGKLIGFAFVDDYNNLRFEVVPEHRLAQIEREIIEWGSLCVKRRNVETGSDNSLDAAFCLTDTWQIAMLERYGFVRTSWRTLSYARSLRKPITPSAFPPGFSLRCVTGEDEVESLVALHRAAFGTENMTVAQRLAIMQAPSYQRELDLVAVDPDGTLAAFCICGVEEDVESERIGFTDPVGTHPRYQQQGLGKAIVTAGLMHLRERDVSIVKLNTSSQNIPMQRLAHSLGFSCVAEKLWFSKVVT